MGWYCILDQYYYWMQWELYDLNIDFKELKNLIDKFFYQSVFKELCQEFLIWQKNIGDIWICLFQGVLVGESCEFMDNYV